MKREVVKSVIWALIVTVLLGAAIIVGSRNLSRFDAALVAYTFASLFAAFGLTYRYTMWLQRPPTALYWRRGWEAFFKRPYRKQNAINWLKRVTVDFGLYHCSLDHLSPGLWLAHVRICARRSGQLPDLCLRLPDHRIQSRIRFRLYHLSRAGLGSLPRYGGCHDCYAPPHA